MSSSGVAYIAVKSIRVLLFFTLTALNERVESLRCDLGAEISPMSLLYLRMLIFPPLFLSASESKSTLLPMPKLMSSDSSKEFSSILLKLAPWLIYFIFSYSSYSFYPLKCWFNFKALLSLKWNPLFIPVYNLSSNGFSSFESSWIFEA